jgi:hypothetical protein
MCIVPKFIIYWFMIMVSLIFKLFVSSRPLKLEGVVCIYVLLFHEGQAENHLLCFPYDLNTRLTFIVSWSFICVSFHLITWLLSFYCQDYVFYAHVLSSLILALNAYLDDQDCDGACHFKNYSFVITYLLEDWYVSNVSIIFDAPSLFLHHLPCVSLHFVAFLCDFRN